MPTGIALRDDGMVPVDYLSSRTVRSRRSVSVLTAGRCTFSTATRRQPAATLGERDVAFGDERPPRAFTRRLRCEGVEELPRSRPRYRSRTVNVTLCGSKSRRGAEVVEVPVE